MTFAQFIAILAARWKLALSVFAAVLAFVITVTVLLPKQYTATAALVIDVKPDPVSVATYGIMTSPAYMATQLDILKSERVARRVVKELKFEDNPDSRNAWEKSTKGGGDLPAWLAKNLLEGLDVKPARESNVIAVEYKSTDAKFSALVANAFVQAYIDTVRDLRVDPAKQYSAFFDERANKLREQLEAAQSRLSAYQRQKGIIATDERLDVETARLNELSAQIVMVQALSAESGSRQSAALGGSGDQMQDVLLNPVIGGLKTSLSQQEARLQELNARLGENHPQVIEARASIDVLRGRLRVETARVTSGVGVSNNINRQREAEIRAAYEAQRQKVLRLKDQRDDAAVFVREVDNAQKAYDAVMVRLNQTALESQSDQTNVSFLTPAVEPTEPSSPKTKLNVLGAVILGTFLAVAAALMLELLNRRVRSMDDVTATLGLPVLGVLPGPDRSNLMRGNAQPLLVRRVLGQLPMPTSRRI